VRLLAWNIRAGGGTRLAAISAAIAAHDADVLVLSEYRGGAPGTRLRAELATLGYHWHSEIEPPHPANGVLIAARRRFRALGPVCPTVPEPWRMIGASFGRLRVTGVYMPNMHAKIPYWNALIAALQPRAHLPTLALGDFNTCRAFVDEPGAIDVAARFMDEIEAIGFRDLWRHRHPEGREFTWYSHRGNGFRIDHAFFSRCLARRTGTLRYSHEERRTGLSDHSALVVELE
jgi:exodeoxyribonuclease III